MTKNPYLDAMLLGNVPLFFDYETPSIDTNLACVKRGKRSGWRADSLVEKLELHDSCYSMGVPRMLVPNAPKMRVTVSGGRTCITRQRVKINLADFGWGEGIQECAVEIKGAGHATDNRLLLNTFLENARPEFIAEYRKRLKQGRGTLPKAQELVHEYFRTVSRLATLKRPWGGQNAYNARSSLEFSQQSFETQSCPIKIAPVFEVQHYTKPMQAFIEKITDGLAYKTQYTGPIAQVKRLMPSTVRGYMVRRAYEERKFETLEDICKLFGNLEDQDDVYHEFLEDFSQYVAVLGASTKRLITRYEWFRVGDVALRYREQDRFWAETRGHEILKDIVLAHTGVYYVDLESLEPQERTAEKDLHERQRMYLGSVFRDFAQVLCGFRLGMLEQERTSGVIDSLLNQDTYRTLEKQVLVDMANICNDHEGVSVSATKDTLRIKMYYHHLDTTEKFDIPLEALGLQFFSIKRPEEIPEEAILINPSHHHHGQHPSSIPAASLRALLKAF